MCDCEFCCIACGPHEPRCMSNEINRNEDDA
jgi:hypothetical protein